MFWWTIFYKYHLKKEVYSIIVMQIAFIGGRKNSTKIEVH